MSNLLNKQVIFGDVVKCSLEGCEQKAVIYKDNKLYCKHHIPKNKGYKIGKYSGYSQYFKDEYGWSQKAGSK